MNRYHRTHDDLTGTWAQRRVGTSGRRGVRRPDSRFGFTPFATAVLAASQIRSRAERSADSQSPPPTTTSKDSVVRMDVNSPSVGSVSSWASKVRAVISSAGEVGGDAGAIMLSSNVFRHVWSLDTSSSTARGSVRHVAVTKIPSEPAWARPETIPAR